MAFLSVAYELSTACKRCQSPLPLNGATESVHCSRCQGTLRTPPEFWADTLSEVTASAASMEETESKYDDMLLEDFGLTVKMTYGRVNAHCGGECKTPYPPEELESLLARGGGTIDCRTCGRGARVRTPPEHFSSVHPHIAGLVGETLASDRAGKAESPSSIRFHCHSCGAVVPLDGKSRTVECGFCHNAVVVPDAIWVRLHPASTVDRWFALIDVGEGLGLLPVEVDQYFGAAFVPGGDLAVAWHADDSGDAGHPARIARMDARGALIWQQDGIEFSNDAKLFASPAHSHLLIVDWKEEFARVIDAADGQPVRTLTSPPSSDHKGPELNLRGHSVFAVDLDGTLLLCRDGGLRRFHPDGRPAPLWQTETEADAERPADDNWYGFTSRPKRLPGLPLLVPGWDGHLYILDHHALRLAWFTRSGEMVGQLELPSDVIGGVKGFGVAKDGTGYLLFTPKERVGDQPWAHLARIEPDGVFSIWIGPLVPDSPSFIGQKQDRLSVSEDGRLLVSEFEQGRFLLSLRIIAPDGSTVFRSPGAIQDQPRQEQELEKLRRGKKRLKDRGDLNEARAPVQVAREIRLAKRTAGELRQAREMNRIARESAERQRLEAEERARREAEAAEERQRQAQREAEAAEERKRQAAKAAADRKHRIVQVGMIVVAVATVLGLFAVFV